MVWDRVVAKTPCKDRVSRKIEVRFQLIMPKYQYDDFFLTMLIKQETFQALTTLSYIPLCQEGSIPDLLLS